MLRQALTPTPAVREAVAGTWAFRATGEREAEDRFRRLARTLDRLGADESVRAMAHEAADDERRHSHLCAELAFSYGVTVELGARVSTPVGAPGLGLAACTLAEVVSLCCIAETLSVAALGKIREATVASDISTVVHELLKDEVKHARLGWAHLRVEVERGRAAFLADLLPGMMVAGIPADLFNDEAEVTTEEALAFGQLPRACRAEVFRETFEAVIFPGFEAAGVDTAAARAWLESQ